MDIFRLSEHGICLKRPSGWFYLPSAPGSWGTSAAFERCGWLGPYLEMVSRRMSVSDSIRRYEQPKPKSSRERICFPPDRFARGKISHHALKMAGLQMHIRSRYSLPRDIYAVFLVLVLLILLISGCSNKKPSPTEPETLVPEDSPQLPSRGFFMGLLPTTAENQSLDDAYAQAAQYSEFVPVWGRPTPFYNLAADLGGSWGRTFVKKLIRSNGMFPIIHLSFIGSGVTLVTPPGMENSTLSDPDWRNAYRRAALDVVKASHPLYLSLGNEVNRWYEKYGEEGPNGFANYVSLYEEIYDAVKELSPETKVFCVFAREIVSEYRQANLDVLGLFNPMKVDLLVFTSYPYSVQGINRPSDIPDEYYVEAANYMPGKSFGFSEIAWASLDGLGGEQAQADFILQATSRLTRDRGINLHLFGWPWLHDLDENDAVGLIKIDGTEKLGYEAWRNISGR